MKKNLSLLFISTIVSFTIVIIALEIIYLSGSVDFYRPELHTFNSVHDLSKNNNRETILCMGDSFTAGNTSYPNILRTMLPHYRIINSGVAGTGIIQAEVMAENRYEQFLPKIFVYQIYVGNDLFDIRYPVNWNRISLARNIYWFTANRLRIVAYINYRIAQITFTGKNYTEYDKPAPSLENDVFDAKKFTRREVIYNTADQDLIEESVLLKGEKTKDFALLIHKLNKMLDLLPKGCRKMILVIPHMAQVNEVYLHRSMQLGAHFTDPKRILETEYPFITQLKHQLHDVTVLNALIPLRNAERRGMRVYQTNDPHLNIRGQEVLAHYIALYL